MLKVNGQKFKKGAKVRFSDAYLRAQGKHGAWMSTALAKRRGRVVRTERYQGHNLVKLFWDKDQHLSVEDEKNLVRVVVKKASGRKRQSNPEYEDARGSWDRVGTRVKVSGAGAMWDGVWVSGPRFHGRSTWYREKYPNSSPLYSSHMQKFFDRGVAEAVGYDSTIGGKKNPRKKSVWRRKVLTGITHWVLEKSSGDTRRIFVIQDGKTPFYHMVLFNADGSMHYPMGKGLTEDKHALFSKGEEIFAREAKKNPAKRK